MSKSSSPQPTTQATGTCRTSTFCASGECVGVIMDQAGPVQVLNTSRPAESPVQFTRNEWSAFVAAVKAGEFNL